jgi:hypothetical protein
MLSITFVPKRTTIATGRALQSLLAVIQAIIGVKPITPINVFLAFPPSRATILLQQRHIALAVLL